MITIARVANHVLPLALPLLLLSFTFHSGAHAATRTTLQEVSEGLTCQCGCGLTVANCNHPNCSFSVPLRGELENLIKRGENKTEILASFRAKYGEKVLSAPTTEGFNILAWTMPFIAIIAGGGMLLLSFGKWHRERNQDSAGSTPAVLSDDDELQRKLRRQLRQEVERRL